MIESPDIDIMKITTLASFPSGVLVALSLSLPLAAAGQIPLQPEPDVVKVADLLFPQSRAWPLYTTYPRATMAELLSAKQVLKATLKAQRGPEDEACSLIDRALEPEEAAAFRKVDLNTDGVPDLVYSGSAHCAEGDSTVIWFATQGGYQLHAPAVRRMLLIRLAPDGKRISSVSRGCCGARADEYHLGNLVNFRYESSLSILQNTQLPSQAFTRARAFITVSEIKLRANPTVIDVYDPDTSDFIGHAVFGNVVKTYMKGARGKAMATTRIHHKEWQFVVMDQESDARVLADPYDGVRAGWIPASTVKQTQ